MPSFTSNSNLKAPQLSYGKIAVAAMLILIFLVSSVEFFFRLRGFPKNIEDSETYWAIQRKDVYTVNSRKRFVVIGTSRSLTDIDTGVMQSEFPAMKVVNLGLWGLFPYQVLKDLAEDPNFDGWILCDTQGWKAPEESAKAYIDYYHKYFTGVWGRIAVLDKEWNVRIKAWLQSHFVLFSPNTKLYEILCLKLKVSARHMNSDRTIPIFFLSKMSPALRAEVRQKRMEEALEQKSLFGPGDMDTVKKFSKNELNRANVLMKKKGGGIIFVRLPTTAERWEHEELVFPKSAWDHISEWSGIPTIHFKDFEELKAFDCPDGSHLDGSDTIQFTRILSRIIKSKIKKGLPD